MAYGTYQITLHFQLTKFIKHLKVDSLSFIRFTIRLIRLSIYENYNDLFLGYDNQQIKLHWSMCCK